jgi:predicted ATP-binding protein involved in virulence
MRIEKLHLKNFRCFKELDIQFPESNLAVFIGLNGAGKSAILDAISWTFSIYAGGFTEPPVEINLMSDNDINVKSNDMEINTKFNIDSVSMSWSIFKEKEKRFKIIENDNKRIILMNSPQYTTLKYNSKREKVFYFEENKVINFSDFKKWFIYEKAKESNEREENRDYNNPNLVYINKAIELFFGYISNMPKPSLKVKYLQNNSVDIIVDWNEKSLNLSQLSDGQRNLLLLVVDITSSLIIKGIKTPVDILSNRIPQDDNALNRKGIILIDEIELHLHPQWQREVLPALQKTFPNIQFIVTTHSPQVLSRVHKDDIFILKDNQLYQPSSNPIGRDSSDILAEIMEITKRPPEIQELSDKYFSLLNRNLFEEAQKIREELLTKLDSEDPIFIRADGLITRKQLLRK